VGNLERKAKSSVACPPKVRGTRKKVNKGRNGTTKEGPTRGETCVGNQPWGRKSRGGRYGDRGRVKQRIIREPSEGKRGVNRMGEVVKGRKTKRTNSSFLSKRGQNGVRPKKS